MKTFAALAIRPFALATAPFVAVCVTLACSGDLADKEEYVSKVDLGQGAKGVTGPQDNGQSPPAQPPTPQPPTPPTGTPSTPPPATTTPPTPPPAGGLSAACADVQTRIFQAKCVGGACHGEPGVPAAVYTDFVNPTDLAQAVKDVPAKANCGSMKLVDSAAPQNSALLKVITSTPQPCVSFQMPVGTPLTTDEVACVTEWVNAVASGAI